MFFNTLAFFQLLFASFSDSRLLERSHAKCICYHSTWDRIRKHQLKWLLLLLHGHLLPLIWCTLILWDGGSASPVCDQQAGDPRHVLSWFHQLATSEGFKGNMWPAGQRLSTPVLPADNIFSHKVKNVCLQVYQRNMVQGDTRPKYKLEFELMKISHKIVFFHKCHNYNVCKALMCGEHFLHPHSGKN